MKQPTSIKKNKRPLRNKPVTRAETKSDRKGAVALAGSSPARYAPPKEARRTVNAVVVLPVEPDRIFTFWELSTSCPEPLIRVIALSGGKSRGHTVFELRAPEHIGSAYILVGPGRRYAVEAGSVGPRGRYTPICRSKEIDLPRTHPPKGKAAIPAKYFRFEPTGSSLT